jgi:hypothetical protein
MQQSLCYETRQQRNLLLLLSLLLCRPVVVSAGCCLGQQLITITSTMPSILLRITTANCPNLVHPAVRCWCSRHLMQRSFTHLLL